MYLKYNLLFLFLFSFIHHTAYSKIFKTWSDITSLLKILYWLPIAPGIKYKHLTMTYNDLALAHLSTLSLHSPLGYTILTPQPAQAGLQIYRVSSQLVCFTLVACLCLEYSSSGFLLMSQVPAQAFPPPKGPPSPVPYLLLYFHSTLFP